MLSEQNIPGGTVQELRSAAKSAEKEFHDRAGGEDDPEDSTGIGIIAILPGDEKGDVVFRFRNGAVLSKLHPSLNKVLNELVEGDGLDVDVVSFGYTTTPIDTEAKFVKLLNCCEEPQYKLITLSPSPELDLKNNQYPTSLRVDGSKLMQRLKTIGLVVSSALFGAVTYSVMQQLEDKSDRSN